MSKAQKKLQKRKAKEREDHKKILAKRERTRAEAKKERIEFIEEKKHRKMIRQVEEMQAYYDQVKDKLPPEVRQQIERNIEVLTSLEEAYAQETDIRKKNNEELESIGAMTLEEKIAHMEKKVAAERGETAIVEVGHIDQQSPILAPKLELTPMTSLTPSS